MLSIPEISCKRLAFIAAAHIADFIKNKMKIESYFNTQNRPKPKDSSDTAFW